MSSPLSQDLAAKIIEVLLQRGHVLLSRGGRPALVRELADRMNDALAIIVGRMPPPGVVDNEVTSTFGDEKVDDAVEEMVEDITASLMDSDQVEDIFSEDAVIRRDVFRVVKDTLLSAERAWGEGEEADVEVALGSLGYVAAKAAQRAGVPMVEGALGRAAKASGAKLLKFSVDTQTATFRAALATPDARLELEEAVADELSSLVDEGKVALPTIDRRLPIGRSLTAEERQASRTRIDIAATRTLLRSGCTATWEFAGDDAIAVSLVPMSDQDGRTVEPHVEAFAREVAAILGRPRPAAEPAPAGLDAWIRLARDVQQSLPRDVRQQESSGGRPPEKKGSRPPAAEPAPTSKRATREQPVSKAAAKEPPASKKPAKPAEPAAGPASRKAAEPAAGPASRKAAKPPVEKPAPTKKPAAKKAAKEPAAKKPAAKKPAAKKPAAKKAAPKAKPAAKKAAPKAKPAAKKAPAKKAPASKRR